MKTKHKEIYKLPNINDKKDKQSFQRYVLIALKEKILLETFKIIKQDIPYIAGPKYALWWDDTKKKIIFHFRHFSFSLKKKKDNMTT